MTQTLLHQVRPLTRLYVCVFRKWCWLIVLSGIEGKLLLFYCFLKNGGNIGLVYLSIWHNFEQLICNPCQHFCYAGIGGVCTHVFWDGFSCDNCSVQCAWWATPVTFFFTNIDLLFRLLLTVWLLYRGWLMFCEEMRAASGNARKDFFLFKIELAS